MSWGIALNSTHLAVLCLSSFPIQLNSLGTFLGPNSTQPPCLGESNSTQLTFLFETQLNSPHLTRLPPGSQLNSPHSPRARFRCELNSSHSPCARFPTRLISLALRQVPREALAGSPIKALVHLSKGRFALCQVPYSTHLPCASFPTRLIPFALRQLPNSTHLICLPPGSHFNSSYSPRTRFPTQLISLTLRQVPNSTHLISVVACCPCELNSTQFACLAPGSQLNSIQFACELNSIHSDTWKICGTQLNSTQLNSQALRYLPNSTQLIRRQRAFNSTQPRLPTTQLNSSRLDLPPWSICSPHAAASSERPK